MRTLIYAPILHSEVDLGSMAGEVSRRFQETFGVEEWNRRNSFVEAMWEGIRTRLLAQGIPWTKVRLYQDGLPLCGRERAIVLDLAARGSPNHRLLAELMDLGATLMGTEDAELLLREHRRIQVLARAQGPSEESRREGEDLLSRRDAFMAHRILSTLEEGETGILFIGLLHRVDDLLRDGVSVHPLVTNPPSGADPGRGLKEDGHGQ